MGKQKWKHRKEALKKGTAATESISFDIRKRSAYLTGFRARKEERRRKGKLDAEEAARQEKIQMRADSRADMKQRWKDMQYAQSRVTKQYGVDTGEDDEYMGEQDDDEDASEEAADATQFGEAPVTVAFDIAAGEEDDPFGDVEITTTVGTPGAMGSAAAPAPAGDTRQLPKVLRSVPGFAREDEEDESDDGGGGAKKEKEWERRRRRSVALKEAEAIRQKALAKKVAKKLELDKVSRRNKKRKKAKGGGKKRKGK
eukprot:gnl/TRDRNA2_/TRDRNA2_191148_c0_seq1.p1 gnl/TRDRNA2_/TRDRNA2_191148_c0~~gnl/TRDRNA2_/TRDRNA2_191148_c0_seq1.p1  ORF type:complete len:256 (+),score=88.76 gnl/TRDRNA2_/TRDRNA2_191148_c0_seq1:99-866(+)